MKKIITFILTALMCFLNSFCVPVMAVSEASADTSVTGIWVEDSNETKAELTFEHNNCKDSKEPVGIAAFYSQSGELSCVYMADTMIENGAAQWNCTIDFNKNNFANVRIMLFELDTMKPLCTSSELTKEELQEKIYHEVPEITDTGTYGIRTAFETGTIECFKYDTYTTQIPEYFITDTTAHTGKYSCKVANRVAADETITIVLNDMDYSSKVKVSCYVKSSEAVSSQSFYIRIRLAETGTTSYPSLTGSTVTSQGDWVHMQGEIDLSGYSLTEAPWIQIMTKNTASGGTNISDYYIDDLYITADTQGMFYDDMNYTPTQKADGISETASEYTPQNIPIEQDIPALKEVYKDYFKMGIAVADRAMDSTSRFGQLISKHFNTMTSEGLFKMSNLLNSSLEYDFANADKAMDFAKKAGLEEIVGHVLVWENSAAKTYTDKFSTRDDLLAFMKEYITKVIKHFEGDGAADEYADGVDYSDWHIGAWDVVNEAAATEYSEGYVNRGGGFKTKIGTDYPIYAFKYANALNYGDVQLRYNDFGEQYVKKADNIYNVVKDIQDGGAKLDIVALQSHYTLDDSVENVRSAFEKIASLGVGIDVSELDISAYTRQELNDAVPLYENGIPKSVEYKQAKMTYQLFELYKEYGDIVDRVTLWSAMDRLSFRNNYEFEHKDYPGIFDRNFKSKPQYWAIADFEEYKIRYPDYSDELENLVWKFEDEYNYGISRDPDIGKWTGVNLNYVQDSTEPSVMNVSDVENYNSYLASTGSTSSAATPWSTVTDPAFGSTKCMTVYNGTTTSAQALGARVKLSKEQLIPGKTYVISFWHMGSTKHGNQLYAFLRPFSTDDNIEEKYGDSVDGIPWVTQEETVGTGTRCWKKITTEITVSESDFNSDGYTNLWLLARAPVSGGKYYKTYKGEYLYLDDIAIYEKNPTSWDFEEYESAYTSKLPADGKWTGVNQAYIQGTTKPYTMSVSNASDYNKYMASTGSTSSAATPTGVTLTPAEGSVRCMAVNNGSSTSAQALGMRVKLSREAIKPGETYTLSFWQMSNTSSVNSIYAFLRKFDVNENISEKVSQSYDAIPWLSEYTAVANSKRNWQKLTVTLSPTEEDFDENGYTTLWILSRSLVTDGVYYKGYKGEYLYIDDITITQN